MKIREVRSKTGDLVWLYVTYEDAGEWTKTSYDRMLNAILEQYEVEDTQGQRIITTDELRDALVARVEDVWLDDKDGVFCSYARSGTRVMMAVGMVGVVAQARIARDYEAHARAIMEACGGSDFETGSTWCKFAAFRLPCTPTGRIMLYSSGDISLYENAGGEDIATRDASWHDMPLDEVVGLIRDMIKEVKNQEEEAAQAHAEQEAGPTALFRKNMLALVRAIPWAHIGSMEPRSFVFAIRPEGGAGTAIVSIEDNSRIRVSADFFGGVYGMCDHPAASFEWSPMAVADVSATIMRLYDRLMGEPKKEEEEARAEEVSMDESFTWKRTVTTVFLRPAHVGEEGWRVGVQVDRRGHDDVVSLFFGTYAECLRRYDDALETMRAWHDVRATVSGE